MIERTGALRGKHRPPRENCTHEVTAKRNGEVRCLECYRVCRFYPHGPVWHYPNRRTAFRAAPPGGTI